MAAQHTEPIDSQEASMSKILAFAAGIAVVIAALLFLFSPVTTDSVAGVPDQTPNASDGPANGQAAGSSLTAGVADNENPGNVSLWPDPDAAPALPARPDSPARDARPVVSLWHSDGNTEKTEVDGFPAIQMKGDPQAVASLHVGQQLALPVPELDRTVTARLEGTRNQVGGIQVFQGPISGGHENDNVVVTRGKTATYVVISTREGVYSAVINNQTGETTMTNEADINDNLAGENDAIPVPGVEQHPPSG